MKASQSRDKKNLKYSEPKVTEQAVPKKSVVTLTDSHLESMHGGLLLVCLKQEAYLYLKELPRLKRRGTIR